MGGYRRHFLIFVHLYPEITPRWARAGGAAVGGLRGATVGAGGDRRGGVYRGLLLPGLVLLEGKDEDNAAEQPGKGDKLLAFYRENAIHEKYLTDDQKKGKDNKDDPAHEFF